MGYYQHSRRIMKKIRENGFDDVYQIMPDMDPEHYERLKESIKKYGVLEPLIFDGEDRCIDGHHRLRACLELGVVDFPTLVMLQDNEQTKLEIIRDLNTARRHLTRDQFREIIEMELIANPGQSDRRAAEKLGVDHKTIGAARSRLEERGEIPHVETVTDTQGRQQPRTRQQTEKATPDPDPESTENFDKFCKNINRANGILETCPSDDYLCSSEGLQVAKWQMDLLWEELFKRKPENFNMKEKIDWE